MSLENTPGLWYSPYVKVYSLGYGERIAEVSNYPRAYKDTSYHVYTKDVKFIVAEDDLNAVVEEERVYRDSRYETFRIGDEATHYKNDPLPGAFPEWLESDDLPFVPYPDDHIFPITVIQKHITILNSGSIKAGPIYVELPEPALAAMRKNLPSGLVVLKRKPKDEDKQTIRIRYQRIL